jgi:hypothetical protein
MRIEIEIPKEFECDYNKDKFKNFFNRVLTDIIFFDGLCGNYEKETAEMLQKAFAESKIAYDVEAKVAELEKEYDLADKEKARCMRENLLQYDEAKGYARGIDTAISIVRGKE